MLHINLAFCHSCGAVDQVGCIVRTCVERALWKYPNGHFLLRGKGNTTAVRDKYHWQCSSSFRYGGLFRVLWAVNRKITERKKTREKRSIHQLVLLAQGGISLHPHRHHTLLDYLCAPSRNGVSAVGSRL